VQTSQRTLSSAILLLLSFAAACGRGSAGTTTGAAGTTTGAAGATTGAAGTTAGAAGATAGAAGTTTGAAGTTTGAAGATAGAAGATAGAAGATAGAAGAGAAGAQGSLGAAGHASDGGSLDVKDGGGAGDGGTADAAAPTNLFTDPFDSFQSSIWSCEYSCPTAANGTARFTLHAGAAPDTMGSWSKIRYKPRRFTAGRFTVRFALTARPTQAVWWGVALWDDGPAADGSQFNEINFGYTTDESLGNTGLRFESTKRGHGVSLKVDTGVDLYDGQLHTGELEYDATHVSFFFDGKLLQTITDTSVIPSDPVDFIIGPRLVTGSPALPADFVESADSAAIAW
jgi:hypothetical protein